MCWIMQINIIALAICTLIVSARSYLLRQLFQNSLLSPRLPGRLLTYPFEMSIVNNLVGSMKIANFSIDNAHAPTFSNRDYRLRTNM